jgi:hypothetical protein
MATTLGTFAWHACAVVVAATSVIVGVIWDISWHMTIGRDTFWTPAHLAIQGGGLLAGLTSGYVAIRTTFFGTPAQKAAGVSFWGFRAPLGAWVCVWGCGAMLTSAPFDDWWHDAYGLDVKIISPPHVLLLLGIISIVLGAMLMTLARQNRPDEPRPRAFRWLFVYSAGLVLANVAITLTEYADKSAMHSGRFYRVAAMFYPLVLLAAARASKLRWAATATAGVYMLVTALMVWILPLFPATPKLGPIYQDITHMVAMDFPLLLVAPALAIDLVLHRLARPGVRDVALAAVAGVVFVLAFLAAQWPFADFLMSPGARNWFFNTENFVYWARPQWVANAYTFDRPEPGAMALPLQLLVACAFAAASSYLGLKWGGWMARVRR